MPAGPVGVEGLTGKTVNGETLRVREVWADNLAEEIATIREVVEDYPYVAMDTEFPGVVARPVGNFKSSREYHYKVGSRRIPGMHLLSAVWGRWPSAGSPCKDHMGIWHHLLWLAVRKDVIVDGMPHAMLQQAGHAGMPIAYFYTMLIATCRIQHGASLMVNQHQGDHMDGLHVVLPNCLAAGAQDQC